MDSLLILNEYGNSVLEKHYRGRHFLRSTTQPFVEEVRNADDPSDISPVFTLDRVSAFIHVYRDRLLFVAVCSTEIAPLLMLELLDTVYDRLLRFFGPAPLTEDSIREQFTAVHLLLDEMIDYGLPATTEPNILDMLINQPSVVDIALKNVVYKPAKILKDLAWSVGFPGAPAPSAVPTTLSTWGAAGAGEGMGLGSGLGTGGGISGCGTEIWWRKGNVTHSTNEIFVDIVERVHSISDAQGHIVSICVAGEIQVNARVSGVPELTLHLKNPALLSNAGFHPCVRMDRFDADKEIVFTPPDGDFVLCSYYVSHGRDINGGMDNYYNNNSSSSRRSNMEKLLLHESSGGDGDSDVDRGDSNRSNNKNYTTNKSNKYSHKNNNNSGNTSSEGGPGVDWWIDDAGGSKGPSVASVKSMLLPLSVKGLFHTNNDFASRGRIELRVTPQHALRGSSGGTAGEELKLADLVVFVSLPKYVASISFKCSSGTATLVESSTDKQLRWSMESLRFGMGVQLLEGSVTFEAESAKFRELVDERDIVVPTELKLTANVAFVVKQWAISGIKVDTVEIKNIEKSPYKGFRTATLSGSVEFRL